MKIIWIQRLVHEWLTSQGTVSFAGGMNRSWKSLTDIKTEVGLCNPLCLAWFELPSYAGLLSYGCIEVAGPISKAYCLLPHCSISTLSQKGV